MTINKIISFCAFIFLCTYAEAQIYQQDPAYGKINNRIDVLYSFKIPNQDTTALQSTRDSLGQIVRRPQDGALYMRGAGGWSRVGQPPGGAVLDSARKSNDTLFFRKSTGGEIALKLNNIPQSGIIGLADSLALRNNKIDTVGTITLMQAYVGSAGALFVKDPLRGGLFSRSASGSPDGGIEFAGVSGYWIRWRTDLRTINIGWFTGEPDGVTDISSIIQGAITKYQRDGAKFYFPTTTQFSTTNKFYRTTSSLIVDSTNVMFYSDGNTETGVAFIKNTSTNGQVITVNSDIFSFIGMGIIGDGGVLLSPVPTTNGILINGNTSGNADADIRNSEFFLLNKSITIKARNVNVYDNIFTNSRYGIYVDTIKYAGEMRGFFIMRNRFHTVGKFQTTDACIFSSSTGNFAFDIQHNYADGQANSVFALLKASKEVTIQNNDIVLNRSNFVTLDSCNGYNISNNFFTWNTALPVSNTPTININGARYGNVSNNTLFDNPRQAIYFFGSTATNNAVSNNTIRDYSEESAGYAAIELTSGTTRNTVTNNKTYVTSAGFTVGLHVLNSNNVNTVFSNFFYPNITLGRPADVESNANLLFNNSATNNSYVMAAGLTGGVKKLTMQAGQGADTAGGAINLYGNSHATYPGQVRIGLSSNTLGKFIINKGGLGETGAGDLMTVLYNGQVGIGKSPTGGVLDVFGDITALTPTGGAAYHIATAGGLNRWGIGSINPTEAAGNIGQDFMLSSYDTLGGLKDSVIVAKRNNGFVGIGKSPLYRLDVAGSINGFTELPGENSTRVATTAWVRGYGIANQLVSAQTGNLWVSGTARSSIVSIQGSANPIIAMNDGTNPQVSIQVSGGALDINNNNAAGTRFSGTAFVGVNITSPTSRLHVVGSTSHSIATVTGNTTLDATHYTLLVNNTGANVTITLPAASTCVGRIYNIKKIATGAFTVTIQGNGAENIDAANTNVVTAQWDNRMIQSNGTQWFIL